MPKQITKTVYEFDELDERAKERTRVWFREGMLGYDWWDCTYDDDAYCTSSPSSSHYSHERSTTLEAVLGEEIDYNETTHKPLEECLVDFMQWIYRRLEEEYNYRMSDEAIGEDITANEYTFTKEGKREG